MHALELAKTVWNAIVMSAGAPNMKSLEEEMHACLSLASRILDNFGLEGDEGGPLEEIRYLRELAVA